jgi:hypothetical protein
MRVFIFKIIYGERHPDYEFTKTAGPAWFWSTREQADRACQQISYDGISVELPLGSRAQCRDFCVEACPQGGFSISCEHPFASE